MNVRCLSILVGLFGFWCSLCSAGRAYLFLQFDASDKGLKYYAPDAISVVNLTHYGLIVSIIVFNIVAVVSRVSAYGIFKRRNWARKTWAISSIFLFIYFTLASCVEPSSLHAYIPGFTKDSSYPAACEPRCSTYYPKHDIRSTCKSRQYREEALPHFQMCSLYHILWSHSWCKNLYYLQRTAPRVRIGKM